MLTCKSCKNFKVADKYRTSNLSHRPGGHTVVVLLKNNKQLEYDKIKNPNAYMDKVLKSDDVIDAWVKGYN